MKNIFFLFLLLAGLSSFAQKKPTLPKEERIPLTAEKWKFDPAKTEFTTYKNVQAIKLKNGLAELKDLVFTNGTIEFDAEPSDAE